MNITKIKEHIYGLSMSINQMMFEGIWDLPDGVTLNSYIVKGQKTAIIDGFIGWDGVPETLYETLGKIDINPEDIDYLIVNHMEPDHSGWIDNFKKMNNHFKIIGTQKVANLIKSFYGQELEVQVVKEKDSIDLGKDLMIEFYPVPNVHWPETMMTYETKTKTLFSCDLYGAFGRMDKIVFDDEMTEEQVEFYELEGVRYFSNVMATFSTMVERAIKKTESLDILMIAPGHGPIYRSHPEKIINTYKKFTQYAKGFGKNQVTVLWGSMYGMTEIAVNYIEEALNNLGVKFQSIQVPQSTKSEIVTQVFQSAGIVLAMPTYEYKMFPPMAHAIDELGRKRITNKLGFRCGSYGWSGGAEKELNQLMETYKLTWDFINNYEFEGQPLQEDFEQIKASLELLLERMKEKIID